MDKDLIKLISKELEQFHCSILLNEVKDNVRKLKAYGVADADIAAVMNDEELFPQLIITENYNIILEGEQQVEIEMEPLIKAVYLLFLSHPEGILLKCLSDYRAELTNIYLLLKPHGMSDRVKRSIMDVTDPTLNSINEKCARIRKIISGILPPNTARYYAISGKRGEVKKIGVARNNVVWRCNLSNHKPCD